MPAKLETLDGLPILRFERHLKHPVAKVWKAITQPDELRHWFPAALETEPRVGAPIRFVFPDEAPVDGDWQGEILELDPPKVFAFRWSHDVLRFELVPDGDGCVLYFSQTLGDGRLSAGRNAAGWDHCLAALDARLDGREAEPFTDWLTAMQRYVDVFGLAEGTRADTPDGTELHFAFDLVWKPVEDARPFVEQLVEPLDGVRWELFADPEIGTRVELTHTVPPERAEAELAAWPSRLKELLAAIHA